MPTFIKSIYQRYRRWILYIYAFLTVSFAAGAVYGWPALRRILRQEGSTLSEEQFGAIFTVGAWSAQGVRFFTGLLRDRFGTRRIAVFALLCSAAGFAGMAWSDYNNPITLGISMFVIGIGSGLILCVSPVAGLFPGYAGSVMSSLSGAFQVSGLVFLVLVKIGPRQATFAGFCFVLFGLAILAFWLLPKGGTFHETEKMTNEESLPEARSEEEELEAVSGDSISHKTIMKGSFANSGKEHPKINISADKTGFELVQNTDSIDPEKSRPEEEVSASFGSNVDASGKDEVPPPTALEQILSLECLLFYAWFSFSVLPLQYYVGSIGFQLEDNGDDDGFYTTLYAAFYSSAALFSPVGGWIADNWGLGMAETFASILCAVAFYLLASSHQVSLNVQIIGLACYGVGRMFVFGLFFAHVGNRFGYQHFGTLAGLGLLLSALVSLLQYPMIAAAAGDYAQEMNLLSGSIFVIMTPYLGWLTRREFWERRMAEQ
jgi:MFS family permease